MTAVLRKNSVSDEENGAARLNLKIGWKFLPAMFALIICTGELHEQIHIQTGRIVCGGYGARDFNAWQTFAECAAPAWAFLATLAGPLWSYAVMWTGAILLLKAKSRAARTTGFALVFAPLPFARIFTAVIGGGDEKVVLQTLLQNELGIGTIKILAALAVLAICLPPILIAYKNIGNRFAFLYAAGFSVLPLVVLGLYVFKFLNPLLTGGFLASAPLLGTPTLIVAHFALAACLLLLYRRRILEITDWRA